MQSPSHFTDKFCVCHTLSFCAQKPKVIFLPLSLLRWLRIFRNIMHNAMQRPRTNAEDKLYLPGSNLLCAYKEWKYSQNSH